MNQYTGLQIRVANGMIAGEGLTIPDLSVETGNFNAFPSVAAYRDSVANISVLTSTVIANGTGNIESSWTANVSYVTGNTVRYNNRAYQATSNVSGASTFQGSDYWTEINDSFKFTVTPVESIPLEITANYFIIKVNSVTTLLAEFDTVNGQLTFSYPLLQSETWEIFADLQKIFYSLAKNFPYALGAVPEVFNQYLGGGNLIDKTLARTTTQLGGGSSAKTFVGYANQVIPRAQLLSEFYQSAATANYGPTGKINDLISAGITTLSGEQPNDYASVVDLFYRLGSLIDFEKYDLALSTAGMLQQLIVRDAKIVGNMHVKVFGKTIVNPNTGKTVTVNESLIQSIVNDSNQTTPAVSNPLDHAIALLADSTLTLEDLDSIKTFFDVEIANIKKFSDLTDITVLAGDLTALLSRKIPVLNSSTFVQFLMGNVSFNDRTAGYWGEKFKQTEIVDSTANPNIVVSDQPITRSDLIGLQDLLGSGGGEWGSPMAADCLGHTNWKTAINNVIAVLTSLTNNSALIALTTDIIAVSLGLAGDWGNVSLSNGATVSDTVQLMFQIKPLMDNSAQTLTNTVSLDGRAVLLKPYNRLAETHNNSVNIFNRAGIVSAPVDDVGLINFSRQLHDVGSNRDKMNFREVLENIIDSTETGQAITSVIIEGKNLEVITNG